MPFEFGIGEVTARLRRAFATRGRTPYQLDETVVPVALVADTTLPPWRTSGLRWAASWASAAVAGQISTVRVGNGSPYPVVVDYLHFRAPPSAIQVGYSTAGLGGLWSAALDTGQRAFTAEDLTPDPALGPCFRQLGPNITPTIGQPITAEIFVILPSGTQSNGLVGPGLQWVIPPQGVLFISGTVVTTAISGSIGGFVYDAEGLKAGR